MRVGGLSGILLVASLCGASHAALGVVSGACVQARGGNITMFLGATLSNTAANTRYDIGMYIDTDSAGSAYSGTTCAREMLKPAYTGTVGTSTCPPLDLADGSGPFLNADGNKCGDLAKSGTLTSCAGGGGDSFMVFPDAITFPCSDLNPKAGFVHIATCATWGNSVDEVAGSTASPPSCT